MSKLGKSLLQGAKEALAYANKETQAKVHKVKVSKEVNVKAIQLKIYRRWLTGWRRKI
jgi:hypothetical protein